MQARAAAPTDEVAVMRMDIDGVAVIADGLPDVTRDEALCYIAQAKTELGKKPAAILLEDAGGGMVRVEYAGENVRFERIRRITGYLVGTIDRWNNAKKAEEQERVKHS